MDGSQGELYGRMRVFGRVQGVLFRDSARRRAAALGLSGYVKNLDDGSLEIVARGEREKVDELFEWARRGPLFARVDRHEIDSVILPENLTGFSIRY